MATCPRCGRVNDPWPLKRADVCSPKDWAVCIRVLVCTCAQFGNARLCPFHTQADFDSADRAIGRGAR